MKVFSAYTVKIKHYSHIFQDTLNVYRKAVDFFIEVCFAEWEDIAELGSHAMLLYLESLTHKTKAHPTPAYDFDAKFYKFPSYLRRAAVVDAYGLVSAYKTNLIHHPEGSRFPKAGYSFPTMYRDNSFIQTGTYTAKLKVFIRNTWDWLDVKLRKSDADYILRHCSDRKCHAPTLVNRGKEFFLAFPFSEKVALRKTDIKDQTIVAVDLGLNHACTCSVMKADGTILGREFLSLPREQDSLLHATNRIKKAQQHGAENAPRLWAKAKGINKAIAVKTASFIMEIASKWNVDVIVFEHLDIRGKKRGSKKQRLHHWRAMYVQQMVMQRAHRFAMRFSRVNAWGTSRLAYDGSGPVERGIHGNYSICRFRSGKVYNCDLTASYNIGARYFVREILKSLPETARLEAEAKVPQLSKRTTCTFSTLVSLHAVLAA